MKRLWFAFDFSLMSVYLAALVWHANYEYVQDVGVLNEFLCFIAVWIAISILGILSMWKRAWQPGWILIILFDDVVLLGWLRGNTASELNKFAAPPRRCGINKKRAH